MNWNHSIDRKPGSIHRTRIVTASESLPRFSLSLLLIFAVLTATLIPIRLTTAKEPWNRPAKAAPRAQSGETVTFYGPRQFDRQSGPPVTVTEQFSIPFGVIAPYTIQVVNGAPNGTQRVSSATIRLNGVELFSQNEIKDSTPAVSQTVALQTLNVLEVRLTSAVGSFLTISFTGIRTVLPPASLVSIHPTRATQGQTLTVALQGQNTHWVQGQTRASFGPEVSVNGAPAGELGNITVTSFTSATAQVTVSATAALSPRTVRVVTPNVPAPFPLNLIEESVTLADGFTVVATSPPGPSSTNVTTIAGLAGDPGFADGVASQARFQNPAGIAAGPDDSIYIADAGNNRIRKLRNELDLSGNPQWVVSTLAGNGTYGFADGPAATAQFKNPQGVAVDGAGVVYVADTSNHRIRKIALDGAVTTVAGDGTAGFADGAGSQARFNSPRGLAVDSQGNIYVADTGNAAVRFINLGGQVSTLAGDGTIGSSDAPPRFDCPAGVALNGSTVYVYLADKGNHRIRRLDSTGTVITLAGQERGFADGSPTEARFAEPSGIAIDGAGKILVTDTINSLIRQVDPELAANGAAGAVTTLAGAGERGYADGPGSAATFLTPRGIATTSSSALIVADTGNHTLRRLTRPPVISAFAPTSAKPAESITIHGQRFDARGPERNIVRFERAPEAGGGPIVATVISATQTSLLVVVPDEAVTGPVTVQTEGGTAVSPTAFEVLPPVPTITGFNPQAGAIGSTVTLTGLWLKAHSGNTTVTFAGRGNTRLPALVTFVSRTEVQTIVPNAAVTGRIELTNVWGQASTNQDFTVNASQDFQISVAPSTATAVQRTAATYLVQLTSNHPTFTQLARLTVAGLPSGVEATLEPSQLTAGASATLTLNLANANLAAASYSFTINAAADIDGNEAVRSAPANLSVIAAGQTTLAGRVLSTEDEPIVGATISLDGQSATSDAAGTFLLTGVTAGLNRPVMIDGRTASAPNRTYPVLAEPANIVAGEANAVPYVFYLPPIDVQHEVILMPGQTNVITTPRVPGIQLTVPANANLRNRDNTPVTRVSITPVPIDRTPTPLPSNVTTAMVYTNQPGGAISDVPMPMVFPNLQGKDPGTRADLYAFNHDTVQWYVYGYGRVSDDGRLIVPEIDPATGQPYGLVDFSWYYPSMTPDGNPGDDGPCPTNRTASPVDLSTGAKIETMTDVAIGGARGSLALTRVFTSDLNSTMNPIIGRFGRGTKDNFDIRLSGTFGVGGAGRVVFPEERSGRLYSYTRTDSDGALVFTSTATISHLGDELRQLTDGTFVYRFYDGVELRFDSTRRLTSIVDRNGNTTTLSYTGSNLTSVTDPVGRSITMTYNGNGLVERVTDPTGRRWVYGYSQSALGLQLNDVTDPLDNVVRYTYVAGPLVSIKDGRGHTIKSFSYNNDGRITRQTFADGGFETYAYHLSGSIVTATRITDSLHRTESKRFNSAGYVIAMIGKMGQTSTIERDINTNWGLSTSGPCGCPEIITQTDGRGNLLAATDQFGQTSRWEYEPRFNRMTRATDKLGRVTSFSYDARGNTVSVINAKNETATFGYDSFGQLTSVSGPASHTTSIEYDAAGNMTAVVDALNNRSTYEYDGLGRLTVASDPLGRRESYEYDALDRIIKVTDGAGGITNFTYDANGNLTSVTDTLNRRWSTAYDEKNRATSTTDPLGRMMHMVYNTRDELVSISSPSGRTTTYTYDARGDVTTITNGLGGIVRFAYDNKRQVTSLTNQRGATNTYTYDQLSRLVGMRDALGRFSTLSYDATGNVLETIDRLGRRSTATYDELNRPITVSHQDAVTTYTYDGLGRTTRIDDSQSGSIVWTYDGARVLSETTASGVVQYSYNGAGQVSSVTAADALPVSYGYDSAGRLQTISQGAETFTYGYDALSRVTSLQRPNGVTTAYSYDDVNRLKRLTHSNGLNQSIEDYRYTYSLDDQISSITSLLPGQVLPAANSASDADAANRIHQFGPVTYSFDLEGQATTRTDSHGTTTFHWDSRGQLRQVVLPGGQTVNYGYDALGRLSTRTLNGVTTNFLHDGGDVVLDSRTDGSTINYLQGGGIDLKLRQTSTATGPLYFLQDRLGSTTALTDTGGNVVELFQYEPYGEQPVGTLTRFGYTGRERDDATGLLYYRARWYDPQLGRFLTEDPAGLIGGLNLYGYVSQDPINSTDPSGLYELDVHYYLTWFLAIKTGCFSDEAARQIAEANQRTDENPDTSPAFGDTPKQRLQNEVFHALHPNSHGPYLNYHWNNALAYGSAGNYAGLGIYLHYFQDVYSHEGFTDSKWGHSPRHLDRRDFPPVGTHHTDKTSFDVEKAMRMAFDTYKELSRFAREVCGCESSYDMSWWREVLTFVEAPEGTWYGKRRYSIEESGNDPKYLENKRKLLDLPPR